MAEEETPWLHSNELESEVLCNVAWECQLIHRVATSQHFAMQKPCVLDSEVNQMHKHKKPPLLPSNGLMIMRQVLVTFIYAFYVLIVHVVSVGLVNIDSTLLFRIPAWSILQRWFSTTVTQPLSFQRMRHKDPFFLELAEMCPYRILRMLLTWVKGSQRSDDLELYRFLYSHKLITRPKVANQRISIGVRCWSVACGEYIRRKFLMTFIGTSFLNHW